MEIRSRLRLNVAAWIADDVMSIAPTRGIMRPEDPRRWRFAMRRALLALLTLVVLTPAAAGAADQQYFQLPKGDYPHDVAVAPDGTAWFSGQPHGVAGRLNPATGEITHIPLGMACSSALTAHRGSPTAGRTPSCGSTPQPAR
jgi:streptogramin lyase